MRLETTPLLEQETATAGVYAKDFNAGDVIQVQKGLIYRVQQTGADTFIYGTNAVSTSPSFLDLVAVAVGTSLSEVSGSLRD